MLEVPHRGVPVGSTMTPGTHVRWITAYTRPRRRYAYGTVVAVVPPGVDPYSITRPIRKEYNWCYCGQHGIRVRSTESYLVAVLTSAPGSKPYIRWPAVRLERVG